MAQIPLTRCQFLMPFVEIHSAIGGPTGSLLAKYRLPTSLDKKADYYVPLLPAIEFAAAAQQQQGLTELAFRASQMLKFEHLSDASRARVRHSPTLLMALQQMCKWASVEDTCLQLWLELHGDHVRICSKIAGAEGIPFMEMSQWVQNIFVLHIVRQFAGAHWSPAVIAFEAPYRPGADVQAAWPNTRFMSAQKASWIEVPMGLLSLPNISSAPLHILCDEGPEPVGEDVVSVLKLSLPAYLDEGGGVHHTGGGNGGTECSQLAKAIVLRRSDVFNPAGERSFQQRDEAPQDYRKQNHRYCYVVRLHRSCALQPSIS